MLGGTQQVQGKAQMQTKGLLAHRALSQEPAPDFRATVSAKPTQVANIKSSIGGPRHFNPGIERGWAGSALELQDPTG